MLSEMAQPRTALRARAYYTLLRQDSGQVEMDGLD
jgi:hypothetical protein